MYNEKWFRNLREELVYLHWCARVEKKYSLMKKYSKVIRALNELIA